MNRTLKSIFGAARVGVCMAGMASFASGSYGADGTAGVEQFELKIMENTLGESRIMAGEYTAAIHQIRSALSLDSQYARSTNLCVAYTAQREYELAEAQCNAALQAGKDADNGIQTSIRARIATRKKVAMALNNLGVLHALQGNNQQALDYFESASSKSRDLEETTNQNLNVLEQRMGSQVVASY